MSSFKPQLHRPILAQISENAELNVVFKDLFKKGGADIYIKPVKDDLRMDKPVNFFTGVEAACLGGEVTFGYRLAKVDNDPGRNYGIVTSRINRMKWCFRIKTV